MQRVIDIFQFVLAFKNLTINDLKPLPHAMSTVRCGQRCHDDKTCRSFFHNVNARQCYSYSGIASEGNTNLTKLDGMKYYLYNNGSACRKRGYTYWHEGHICYKRMQGRNKRYDALVDCDTMGGSLFSINTEQKHLFFVNVVAKMMNQAKCYISGIRNNCSLSCDGGWTWERKRKHINESDPRWHSGSPGARLGKNCMVYSWKNGKYLWEDTTCILYAYYICEFYLNGH